MSFETFTSLWASLTPAAANHIWQSTVFALAAAALTLLLRKNQARVRYWLWLAASIKFLIPFALLVALGSAIAPSRALVETQTGYRYAAEVSQPFNRITLPATAPAALQHLGFATLLPVMLLSFWLCGCFAVLTIWFHRWRRIHAIGRRALPVNAGREVEALRRLERAHKIHRQIPLRRTEAPLEPGIFGFFRPVLLWPQGISAHLDDVHLEAILAHELRHVRYRDNLAAALHAIVQAIFWFHPLVWWMGAQMVRERELGCDEEVISMGSRPGIYAEGILKACEFCVASPLASFSGVTGADLKQRIARIMSGACGHRLAPGAKRLLVASGVAAFAAPLLFGLVSLPRVRAQILQASGPLPSFEVVSVKPSKPGPGPQRMQMRAGGFVAQNVSLRDIIQLAYKIGGDDEIEGAPSWINTARYDIDAKEDDATVQKLNALPLEKKGDEVRLMIQSLLIDRFQLKFSMRREMLPVYALMVAKSGPKLAVGSRPQDRAGQAAATAGGDGHPSGISQYRPGSLQGVNAPMSFLAHVLSGMDEIGGRIVLDRTNLTEVYNFKLSWAPEQPATQPSSQNGNQPSTMSSSPDSSGPSLFTALQEQLGLKLVSQKGPVAVLVIDHIERPSPN